MAKEIWEWTKAIIIAIILAFIIRSFIFATSVVEGASMHPTLENGERVVFNKAIYYLSEPDRGDIVIIQRPSKNYVKRVIGLPNDVVEVKNHSLYINSQKQTQSYLDDEAIKSTSDFGPITVPEGEYFVMGDNRSISKDSRNGLGLIKEDEIIGRSELIIYPFDEFSLTR
ncbi:signal peptidase I [Salinibacillus aidingensis]|uniref:Signal peptidase I n=1 Tax=Salinibacillus aidingensis TaxID=237684 RepID=A0ABN1BBT1_9BACI